MNDSIEKASHDAISEPLDSFSAGRLDGSDYNLISYALRRESPEVAKLLLKNLPNVDVDNGFILFDDPPLVQAATSGYTEIVSMLLDRNFDTNVRGKNGMTPLHHAAASNHLETVTLLINRNASIYAHTTSKSTPILEAIREGHDEIIKEIYNHGVKIDDTGYTRWIDEHCTSLHLAVFQQDLSLVDLLLRNGSDVNTSLRGGKTALFLATIMKDTNIIKLLLERGANIDARDNNDDTVLHYAARSGCTQVLEVLLAGEPTVDVYNQYDESPVFSAIYRNDMAILKILFVNGGQVGPRSRLKALELACMMGHTEIVKFLVEKTGYLQTKSLIAGHKRLRLACFNGVSNIVETLLTMGADIEIRDKKETTTHLHTAIFAGHPSVVRILLNRGADVNATDNRSLTPIDIIDWRHRPSTFKATVEIFSDHVLTMLSRDLYVSEKNLKTMDIFNKRIGIVGNLQSEVARMKTKKIGDSTVSFNDIVRGNIHQLMNYARNDNIVKILESDELNKDFPISSNVMKRNIKEGQNQLNLMHSSRESLIRLIGYDVPEVVTNEIGQYFSNNDLRNIIDADNGDDVDSKKQEDVIA